MLMFLGKITFFDLETTDKIPCQSEILTGHFKTIEWGKEDARLTDQLSITAKPNVYLQESYSIHGISEHEASTFEPKRTALAKILSYLKKHNDGLFCCHANALTFGSYGYFDWQVIRLETFYESDRAYFWWYENFRNSRVISTHTLAKRFLHLDNYKLDTVATFYGHTFKHHSAEEDCDATIHIFKRLLALSGADNHDDLFRLGNGYEYFDSNDYTNRAIGGLL
jgi:DNA polymerase III epsilon subunit-like protein